MESSKLDKIYTASGDAQMLEAYDEWASEYDRDVGSQGYVTPKRVADALAQFSENMANPVMDYGCGTGLSGVALKEAGFSHIAGADLSPKMLEIARERDIYEELRVVEPEAHVADELAGFSAIAATGVISRGAAPPSLYGEIVNTLPAKGLLAFSLNDLSRDDPEYADLVKTSVQRGEVALLFEEYGPHLSKYGKNSGSTVYVVERVG